MAGVAEIDHFPLTVF